jgi:hypothetical protein
VADVTSTLQQFGDQALQFREDVNVVQSEQASADRPAGKEPVAPALKRMSDAPELAFFTLGPIYVRLGVAFDIMQEFQAVTKRNFEVLTFDFNHTVMDGMGDWSRKLQATDRETLRELYTFLATQRAKFEENGLLLWCGFDAWNSRLADPFAVDRKEVISLEITPATVCVFTPASDQWRLIPKSGALMQRITLFPEAPRPDLVMEAAAGLGRDITAQEHRTFIASRGQTRPVL